MEFEATAANVSLLRLKISLSDWVEFQQEAAVFNQEKIRSEGLKLEVRCVNSDTDRTIKKIRSGWIKHYKEEWPQIQRRSFLLSVCSEIEFQLTEFTDTFAQSKKSTFRIKDISGKGISRCELLLKRLGVPDCHFHGPWTKLKNIFKIRNRVAHAGALYDPPTLQIAKGMPEIFLSPGSEKDRVTLTENWMEPFSDIVGSVLDNLTTTKT